MQSRLATSRNDLPFAHLHLLLWQGPAHVYRLQLAHSSPENKLVLGNCWFHFYNSPFVSEYPCQMCGSPLVLSACFGKFEPGRQGCVRWSQWVWMGVRAVSTAKMPFFIAAEEHTRSPELQRMCEWEGRSCAWQEKPCFDTVTSIYMKSFELYSYIWSMFICFT